MFTCKVCIEKDKRISDLKAQLLRYHELVRPNNSYVAVDIEANKILEGSVQPVVELVDEPAPNNELDKELLAVKEEEARILAGTY